MRISLRCSVGLVLALGVIGCGSDDDTRPVATPTAARTPTPSPTATAAAPSARVISPTDNSTVVTFTVPIEITVDDRAPAGTIVTATLNGSALNLSGGPRQFTTTVQPGAPLRDDNTIVVRVAVGDHVTETQSSFAYQPPKARARRISDSADLIHGPLAHGRIGDYLLANSEVRYIVQDVAKRDLYSVGAFGGNIIDAELTARPGTDNFLEVQPALNIETVINAQTAEIVNDGADGTAAIIRTCGPDDLLDFVNPSTIIQDAGLTFPAGADDKDYDIDACTEYILEPGKTAVRMVTTVFNNENQELGLFAGDFINGSGELEQWTSAGGGGLGEQLTNTLGVMSYIGYGEAAGVDYALVPLPIAGSSDPRSSFFTASGVSYIMQSNSILRVVFGGPATFTVPAHGSNSYARYFAVGDGSGGNAVSLENEVKEIDSGTLRGCVTAGGVPAPQTKVSALRRGVAAPYVTDGNGCYEGTLPVGAYKVGAARRGYPYEGGGTQPFLHDVTITPGQVSVVNIDLPATGRLHVDVVEAHADGAAASPIPARISVVGFDPSPESTITLDALTGKQTMGLYNDISADPVPFGFTWMDYAGADGSTEFELEPGTYRVYVSRGVEYSLFDAPVTITAGNTTRIDATLVHVIETAGFISSDFHVHSINSADSRVSLTNRARQFAGEGVDNIIMTDHHSHTDLNPRIGELGLSPFVHATIGEEITTWDYGHFNAYPLTIDPTRPSGGSTDWAGAAPPGRDFPEYGAYSLSPGELQTLAVNGSTATPDTTIQINHIDSFFKPLVIDTSLVPPATFLSSSGRARFRLDPNGGNLFAHFKALELWNGAGRGAQDEFLTHRLGVWMNHLNQGLITTFIADTDTHEFRNLNTAGARTWTAASQDAPPQIDVGEIARSVNAGKAVGGQGVYVQSRLLAADGSGQVADLTRTGSTVVSSAAGVDLEIHIQAPLWAEYDRVEIYANAPTVPTVLQNGVPVLFTASPTTILTAGTDFSVARIDVLPGVSGASRWESTITAPFHALIEDTWFVVVVHGSDGVSRPMYPVMSHDLDAAQNKTLADLVDGNLGEGGTLALGVTNALYADVDGVSGFQAPLAGAPQ